MLLFKNIRKVLHPSIKTKIYAAEKSLTIKITKSTQDSAILTLEGVVCARERGSYVNNPL